MISRRALLAGAGLLLGADLAQAAGAPPLTVYKTASCGCCKGWITLMTRAGYRPNVVVVEDVTPFNRRYGVPFAHNPHFPINTLTLMRGALGLQMHQPERLLLYGDAVYRAIWVDGKDMNDPAVVGAVLQDAGFDARQLLALTQQQQVKDGLKTVTQDAAARGVFGAPTFFVGNQMFWGQDRLDFVREALR